MEYISNSVDDTKRIAADFAHTLKSGDVAALFGDLGAGKTAFVQGIASALGVDEYITSPTFVILNEYEGEMPLYHFDMYRLEGADEYALTDIGYFDAIAAEGICAIEWSEYITDFLPKQYYRVTMRVLGEESRKITIEKVEEGRRC